MIPDTYWQHARSENTHTTFSTMYATKRRRRTVKPVKPPMKDPPKSNPSKRHRERLNSELDHLATLLPFEQSVISKLDKLSVLRLAASYFRIKSYFRASLHERYALGTPHHGHPMAQHHHLYAEPAFVDTDSVLQALSGFMFMVNCTEGEVFFASRTVEQYLGFHQSDIIHQSVLELIHSEDRDEFKSQLNWRSQLPSDQQDLTIQQVMMPENCHYLNRCFTVRFRCLLDNTSGFITLEISGRLKFLHGQSLKAEIQEPPLSLFAICCPFGPVPMLDMPPRDYTFKSKHKMDMAPVSMDPRGKILFGFCDQELLERGGYDLIHPEDLNYYAAAHQELIKTGSSGLIAYRLMTKDMRWIWLQTSSKVVYKNSKPDFVICTHRHLTEDEGKDLFGKRGSEFKLPYPIIDADPSGFGAALEEEDMSKIKTTKKKSKTQLKDYLQAGRKRKTPYREVYNGLNGYPPTPYSSMNSYPGYGVGDMKNEFLTSYGGIANPALETAAADLYRNGTYPPFATAGVYPATDSLRLDVDRYHTNGYYFDSVTRPYQHTLQYPSNGYSDLVSHTKYPYDVSKYGYDSFVGGYGLDLSKRTNYYDTSKFDSAYRAYDSSTPVDKLTSRVNGTSYDSLRKSSLYDSGSLLNPSLVCGAAGGDSSPMTSPPCSLTTGPDLSSRSHIGSTLYANKDTLDHYGTPTPSDCVQQNGGLGGGDDSCKQQQQPVTQYTSVIRSTSPTRNNNKSPAGGAIHYPGTNSSSSLIPGQNHLHHHQSPGLMNVDINSWPACGGVGGATQNSSIIKSNPGSSGNSAVVVPNSLHLPGLPPPSSSAVSDSTSSISDPSPTSAHTPAIADHDRENNNCRGIAVPVVRSSAWLHASATTPTGHAQNGVSGTYPDWHLPPGDCLAPRACSDALVHPTAHGRATLPPSKPAILRDGENASADNPLLSFSQMTHTLMSTG